MQSMFNEQQFCNKINSHVEDDSTLEVLNILDDFEEIIFNHFPYRCLLPGDFITPEDVRANLKGEENAAWLDAAFLSEDTLPYRESMRRSHKVHKVHM